MSPATFGEPLTTLDTVARDTPASAATISRVGMASVGSPIAGAMSSPGAVLSTESVIVSWTHVGWYPGRASMVGDGRQTAADAREPARMRAYCSPLSLIVRSNVS